VIADDGHTGLWHTLDAYTDLTVARPALVIVVASPRHATWSGGSAAPVGHRTTVVGSPGEDLLTVGDSVMAHPGWRLVLLGRTRRDPERYQVCALDRRGTATRPAWRIDTWNDWARL